MASRKIEGSCDVAIVGLGPVGATLAHLLGTYGLSVVVVEREQGVYPLPRAVHFDDEVMRVFQTIGIADAMASKLFVNKGMRFVTSSGRLLIDWPRPQAISDQGWHSSYRFHQPDLEALLRTTLDRFPRHDVRLSTEAIAVAEDGEGVTLTVRDLRSGAKDEVRSRFLVGCDGAKSLVRQAIGAELIDLRSDAEWIVVDVLMKRPRPDLSDWTIQICDPVRPTTLARGTGDRRRWEFMVIPGDDRDALTSPDFLWSLLSRWIMPEDAELERAAVYRFNAVIAAPWRRGRLFIAGDAAHRTPPFLGQGLCAGIRDAANLAWKLAYALEGRGEPDLLDSYESERAPHVQEFVAQAVRVGSLLQGRSPPPLAAEPERMLTPAPPLGGGLHDPADPHAGRLFAQPFAADGRRMDDVIGQRFALIVRQDEAAVLPATLRAACDIADVPLFPVADRELVPAAFSALLIRPDRYVLASLSTFALAEAAVARLGPAPRAGAPSWRIPHGL